MPRPLNPGELHTYDEWLAIGYQVQRGQHHVARAGSRVLFSSAQVRPRSNRPQLPGRRAGYQQAPRRVRRQEQSVSPAQSTWTYTATYQVSAYTTTRQNTYTHDPFWVSTIQQPAEKTQKLMDAERAEWEAYMRFNKLEKDIRDLDRKYRALVPPEDRGHPGLQRLDRITKEK